MEERYFFSTRAWAWTLVVFTALYGLSLFFSFLAPAYGYAYCVVALVCLAILFGEINLAEKRVHKKFHDLDGEILWAETMELGKKKVAEEFAYWLVKFAVETEGTFTTLAADYAMSYLARICQQKYKKTMDFQLQDERDDDKEKVLEEQFKLAKQMYWAMADEVKPRLKRKSWKDDVPSDE